MHAKQNFKGLLGLTEDLTRAGDAPKDRLTWALKTVSAYRQREKWSPVDWEIACLELAVFAGSGKTLPGHGGILRKAGEIVRPSPDETNRILARFLEMFEDAEQHKPIRLEFPISQDMTWDARAARYHVAEYTEAATWEDRARYALAHLLKEDGHRVCRCPAKLPHGGKVCRAFFLKAKRGKYCSRECASREMTRRFREREGGSHGKRKK